MTFYQTATRNQKIKIEFSDSNGARYSFTAEGATKDNVVKIIEFVESVSQTGNQTQSNNAPGGPQIQDTNFARICLLVQNTFQFGSFTSADVLEAARDKLGLDLTLPTVSTYLSRLAERALLLRTRNGAGWLYRVPRQQEEHDHDHQQVITEAQPLRPTISA